MRKLLILKLFVFFCLYACSDNKKEINEEEYRKELEEWKTSRLERLRSERGWLNLAGLYWLSDGYNSIGSDSTNDIVFPEKAPQECGIIFKSADSLVFMQSLDNKIMVNGSHKDTVIIQTDASGKMTLMETGSLAWYIIKRDRLYGVRLRDYQHPRLNELDSIPAFKPSLEWRKTGVFIPFEEPYTISVPTVIGIDEFYRVPGKISFEHEGKKHKLLPFSSGDGLFLIIGDKTSADETYAAGRFMYTEGPDKNNQVILDFNKAYNPPCAFSPFATCPLPPPENRLDIRITAGEKALHLD